MLTKLSQLVDLAKAKRIRKIAVAGAGNYEVLHALQSAQSKGIMEPLLVGNKKKIEELAKLLHYDISKLEIADVDDRFEAALTAAKLVKEGHADILMKGLVSSQFILKAVLHKDVGLRKGDLISHVAFFESPYYHKILAITDAAMNVDPSFEEKISIINNAVEAFHALGVMNPKVAVVGSVETVNPKMESTMHAATLSMMNKRKQIRGCIIDGPLALDNAVSKKAAEVKEIESEVAGDADLIVAPDINGANFLYKALNFLGGADSAAVIMGAKVPVVLTSRSDTGTTKFLSIALAAAIS